eukprot:TRINITY_DN6454_c0_g1_i7.p1 TRINITY_DN6454_c0_g1~~TRINITY_DN6454_c0_g1_i7.p1  ORF type:complete len:1658 (+),score=292.59 TRINITY_DN6454_c0_g1_i7:32-4975(+)
MDTGKQCSNLPTTSSHNNNNSHNNPSAFEMLWVRVDPADRLPDEVMLAVLLFLPPADLDACRRVSKTWQRVTDDHQLWQTKFTHEFGGELSLMTSQLAAQTASSHRVDEEWSWLEDSRKLFWKEWNLRGRWRDGRYSLLYGAGNRCAIAYLTVTTIHDRKYVVAIDTAYDMRVWDTKTWLSTTDEPLVTKQLRPLIRLFIYKEVVNSDEIAILCSDMLVVMPVLDDGPEVFRCPLDPWTVTTNTKVALEFTKQFVVRWPDYQRRVEIIPRDSRHQHVFPVCGRETPLISLFQVGSQQQQQGTNIETTNTYMAVLFPEHFVLYIYCVTYSSATGIKYELLAKIQSHIKLFNPLSMKMTRENVVVTSNSYIVVCNIPTGVVRIINTVGTQYSWVDNSKVISVSKTGLVEHYALVPSSEPVCVFSSSCYTLQSALERAYASFYVDSTCVAFADELGNVVYSEFGADASDQRQALLSSPSSKQNLFNGLVRVNQLTMELLAQVLHLYKCGGKDCHLQLVDKLQAGLETIYVVLQSAEVKDEKWYPAAVVSHLEATLHYELVLDELTTLCDQFIDSHNTTRGIDAVRFGDICRNLESVVSTCSSKQVYTPLNYGEHKVAAVLARLYKCFNRIALDLELRQIALLSASDACWARTEKQVIDLSNRSADLSIAKEAKALLDVIVQTRTAFENIPARQLGQVFGLVSTDTVFAESQPHTELLKKLERSMNETCTHLELGNVRLLLLQHAITEHTFINDVQVALMLFNDYADPTTESYTRLTVEVRAEVQSRLSDYHKFIHHAAELVTTDVSLWSLDGSDMCMHKWRANIERVLSALCKMHELSPTLQVSMSERRLMKMRSLLDLLLKLERHQQGKLTMNVYELADMWRMLKITHEDSDLSSFGQLQAKTAQAIALITPELDGLNKRAKAVLLDLLEELNNYISHDLHDCSYVGKLVHIGETFLDRLNDHLKLSNSEWQDDQMRKWLQEGIVLCTNALNSLLLNSMDLLIDDSESICHLAVLEEAIAVFTSQRDKPWVQLAAAAQRLTRLENLKDELLLVEATTLLEAPVHYQHGGCETSSSILSLEVAARQQLGHGERSQMEKNLHEAKDKLNSVSTAGYCRLPQATMMNNRISALIDAERQLGYILRARKDLLQYHTPILVSIPRLTPSPDEIADNVKLKPTAQVPLLLLEISNAGLIVSNLRKSALKVSPKDAAYTELLSQAIGSLACQLAQCSEQLTVWIEAVLDHIEAILDTTTIDSDKHMGKYLTFTDKLLAAIADMHEIDFSHVRARLSSMESAILAFRSVQRRQALMRQMQTVLETVQLMSLFEIEQQTEWLNLIGKEIEANATDKALHLQCQVQVKSTLKSRLRQSLLADLYSVRNLDTRGMPINLESAQCLLQLCTHRLNALPGYIAFQAYMSCLRQGDSAEEPADAELFCDLYFAHSAAEETISSATQAFANTLQKNFAVMELQNQARDQVDYLVKAVLSNSNTSSNGPVQQHGNNVTQTTSRFAIRERLDMLSGLISGLDAANGNTKELIERIGSVQKRLYDVLMQIPEANNDGHIEVDKASRYIVPVGSYLTADVGSCYNNSAALAAADATPKHAQQQQQQYTADEDEYLYDSDYDTLSSEDDNDDSVSCNASETEDLDIGSD